MGKENQPHFSSSGSVLSDFTLIPLTPLLPTHLNAQTSSNAVDFPTSQTMHIQTIVLLLCFIKLHVRQLLETLFHPISLHSRQSVLLWESLNCQESYFLLSCLSRLLKEMVQRMFCWPIIGGQEFLVYIMGTPITSQVPRKVPFLPLRMIPSLIFSQP